MKLLRYFLATSLLTLMLAINAFAGEMTTGSPTPSPTSAPVIAEGEMTTGDGGDMHTGNTEEATAGDAVAEGALSLLQGVLSLL